MTPPAWSVPLHHDRPGCSPITLRTPLPTMTVEDQTVLVTGGTGFIGSHLVAALSPDNDVRVLDRRLDGSVPAAVDVIQGDVRDDAALQSAFDGVDCVFHLAAMVNVGDSVESPQVCHETNASATVSILEHARRADARVLLASSAAVYGTPDSVPVAETARKRPQSPYGVSKLAADQYARRYADLYDLPTVSLRYFNVYGPRPRGGEGGGVIGAFRRQASDGGPLMVEGDGKQTRDFVHVSDVVRANLLAATTDHTGEAFNIGTGDRVSIRRLAELVRDATGVDADIVHTDPRPGDVRHSCADIEKARSKLDYHPTVSLVDGLHSVLAE